jgi:hypothetical protein
MGAHARIGYPTKALIERVVAAARASGIDVSGFEVFPDGRIKIVDARAKGEPANDFDRWEKEL